MYRVDNPKVDNVKADVYEEEKSRAQKKAEKKAAKAQKKTAAEKAQKNPKRTVVDFKKSVRKARHKSEFFGIMYLVFSIILAVSAIALPLFIGASGYISVATFWKPFLGIKNIGANMAPVIFGLLVPVCYAFIVLSVVVNVFKAFGCMKKLFKARPSKQNGYNRPMQAMERLGILYSRSLKAIVFFGFIMTVFAGVAFTTAFWLVVAIGLLVHFWLGYTSGGVSHFRVGRNTEVKRVGGRFAPLIRNVFQIVTVAIIMGYFAKVCAISNLAKLFEKDVFANLFKDSANLFVYIVLPVVHILMFVAILTLFNHAFNPTEFDHDGKAAKGRITYRVGATLLLIFSAVAFGVNFVTNTMDKTYSVGLGEVYIAVIALAILIEEISTRHLPNFKDDYIVEYEQPAACYMTVGGCGAGNAVHNVDLAAAYHVPLQCVTEPAVYMQPNGIPVMVMPMMAGFRPIPAKQSPAAWYSDRPYDPYHNKVQAHESVNVSTDKVNDLVTGEGIGMTEQEANDLAAQEMKIKYYRDKWIKRGQNPVALESSETDVEPYNYAQDNPFMANTYAKAHGLTQSDLSRPLPPKDWTVTCPDCSSKLAVQDGSFAYRCPDCGCVFQLKKTYKNKKN